MQFSQLLRIETFTRLTTCLPIGICCQTILVIGYSLFSALILRFVISLITLRKIILTRKNNTDRRGNLWSQWHIQTQFVRCGRILSIYVIIKTKVFFFKNIYFQCKLYGHGGERMPPLLLSSNRHITQEKNPYTVCSVQYNISITSFIYQLSHKIIKFKEFVENIFKIIHKNNFFPSTVRHVIFFFFHRIR